MAEPDPPGPPEFSRFKQYFTLTLTLDSGTKRASLTAAGPQVPETGVMPIIGVGRDSAGNYHFLIGHGEDHVYRPQDVPAEILKLLGGSGGGPSGPPTTKMWLPARDVLRRKSDGAFMTFAQYEANRLGAHRPGAPTLGGKVTLWPELTPEIFYLLIDLYSGKGQRSRSRDYGDYPLPAGNTGVA